MRLDEITSLHDVLNGDQYLKLLRSMRTDVTSGINVASIKNQVIQSWKTGIKNRKHYDGLMSKLNLSLHDIIN